MPFVRFSRDKRGYEHVYLVHANNNRGASSAPRILYWYRTPPGVKVGREPFDETVRRALEAEYPNLVFDWKRIVLEGKIDEFRQLAATHNRQHMSTDPMDVLRVGALGRRREEARGHKRGNQITQFLVERGLGVQNLDLALLRDARGALAVSGMAILNTGLALVQEFRAKRHLDRLSLLSESRVRVLRDGSLVEISSGDVVRGEINTAYHVPNRPFFDTVEMKGGGDATSAARARTVIARSSPSSAI